MDQVEDELSLEASLERLQDKKFAEICRRFAKVLLIRLLNNVSYLLYPCEHWRNISRKHLPFVLLPLEEVFHIQGGLFVCLHLVEGLDEVPICPILHLCGIFGLLSCDCIWHLAVFSAVILKALNQLIEVTND